MYTITKEYHFSASHVLKHLPADHPCARLHGHNYIVKVELQSDTLNANGFVVDYRDLDALKHYINDSIDHRHLNDVLGDNYVTAELIAQHFYEWCKKRWAQVSAVMVSETPRTWAEYRL
jgi:6-pyruvoyltetrahydropterin/6-carboxytetrahydropterin synthase